MSNTPASVASARDVINPAHTEYMKFSVDFGSLRKYVTSMAGKLKDLTGKTFNKFTVLHRVHGVQKHGTFWLCTCTCGNTQAVRGTNLTSGSVKRCKECKVTRTPEDLTGTTFGKLTPTRLLPRNGLNPRWECMCSCGKLFEAYAHNLKAGATKSCGCARHAKKGLTYSQGYASVWMPEHPRAGVRSHRVLEHILVMEAKLGRYLVEGEEIHHLNSVRDDNRIENLELWTKSQPAGGRVTDKVSWAISLIKQYQPELLK